MRHCDDYIEDRLAPAALKRFLEWHRRPAIEKTGEEPTLYAVLLVPLTGKTPMKAGARVRVVMASRFGDVGITPNLNAAHGYVARVAVRDLGDFRATN